MHTPCTHHTLLPGDLAKLLGSYSALRYCDGPTPRMLDAVAGYIVKRIRNKHMNAMAQPQHVLAVLRAYAELGHVSVVVPELIGALSLQVCVPGACGEGLHVEGVGVRLLLAGVHCIASS